MGISGSKRTSNLKRDQRWMEIWFNLSMISLRMAASHGTMLAHKGSVREEPRYTTFWSVSVVFTLLRQWGGNSKLSLKLLSYKSYKLKKLLKHNRLGDPLDSLVLKTFPNSKELCVVRILITYLKRTETLRGNSKQLLVAPHGAISRNTLARWTT